MRAENGGCVASYGSARVARASSIAGARLLTVLALLCGVASAVPALAQEEPDSTRDAPAATDSLLARLERAEAAIALLRQQLGVQEAAGVHSASRIRLELSGRVLMNAFSNTRRVNNADVPQFVRPDTGAGLPSGGGGAAIRQTTLGLFVSVDEVFGGTFLGDLDLDFYGGQQPSSGGRSFPLLRVRTARARLQWSRAELLAGQESPLIAGVDPLSIASIGFPDFAGAGNLWLWLPQLRAGVETGSAVRIGVQGAVLAPSTGDPTGPFDTDVDAAERSRRPVAQARLRVRWGEPDDHLLGGEVGCGVHRGWLATAGDSLLASEGIACDWRAPLPGGLDLRGEVYRGRGLRGLGGGGIGQLLAADGSPLEDRGGWMQVNWRLTTATTIGTGCGAADPEDDLPATGRLRNVACAAHLTLRPAGPLVVGAEYRRLETTYRAGTVANDHLNLAVGFEF
jgi:hypothetical protein